MKTCILIIYSDNHEEMLEIPRENFKNTNYYFVQFKENQENEISIENDFIYIKGKESLMNILYKTVKAMEYVFSDYDYIIRTNVSTLINVPKLLTFLENKPTTLYTSPLMSTLNWLDFNSGITDSSFFGTIFASGTSIIISKNVVENILNNKSKLNHNVLDDVAIGIYINKYMPEAIHIHEDLKLDFVNNCNVDPDCIFFRHKTNNRNDDVINMKNTYLSFSK